MNGELFMRYLGHGDHDSGVIYDSSSNLLEYRGAIENATPWVAAPTGWDYTSGGSLAGPFHHGPSGYKWTGEAFLSAQPRQVASYVQWMLTTWGNIPDSNFYGETSDLDAIRPMMN